MTNAFVLPPLSVRYEHMELATLLAEPGVLAVFGYGRAAPVAGNDPRYNRVALEPVAEPAPFEVWRVSGVVNCSIQGALHLATDGNYLFGRIELDETEHGGIAGAATAAYAELSAYSSTGAVPNILRVWNYFSKINVGEGDSERYKQFCIGRTAGMGNTFVNGFPAATAIGRLDEEPSLQIFWLAACAPGVPFENPRQTNAYHYPRQYGPVAPSFVRAMLASSSPPQLHISGTAAVVGHSSQHNNDPNAQFLEIMANLDSLLTKAACFGLAAQLGGASALKIYIRRPEYIPTIIGRVRDQLPENCAKLLLYGDICRDELLVEVDGVHG